MDNFPCVLFSLLQGLWYGIRCLNTLSDIGFRRQQNTWSGVCCVVRGASLCLGERLSWMTTSWENTPQLRRKPGTTCSTIKVRANVWNVTKRIPSCKSLTRDRDHWFEEIRLNEDQEYIFLAVSLPLVRTRLEAPFLCYYSETGVLPSNPIRRHICVQVAVLRRAYPQSKGKVKVKQNLDRLVEALRVSGGWGFKNLSM